MEMQNYIKYLENLIPKDLDIDKKYFDKFSKYATYIGNGVYEWGGFVSTNTRALYLMVCLSREKINFKKY